MLCKTDSIKFAHVITITLLTVHNFSQLSSLAELAHNLRPSTTNIKTTRAAMRPRIQYMTFPPFFWWPYASTIFSCAFSALLRAFPAFTSIYSKSSLCSCILTFIYFAMLLTSFINVSTLSRSSYLYFMTSAM